MYNANIISWLIIFIVLLIFEISTVSLVSIWFCLGCVGAMVSAYLGFGIQAQLIVFIVVSAISMACARPLKKKLKGRTEATNVNALIGKVTYVTEGIDNRLGKGSIKVNDVVWLAKSVDGEPLEKGTKVVIKEIKGVKAYVEKAEETIEE